MTSTAITSKDLELFGALVSQLRATRGLSVADFAERSGLSLEAIEQIEKGWSEYPLEELFAIARGLGILVSAIFRIWDKRNVVESGPVLH